MTFRLSSDFEEFASLADETLISMSEACHRFPVKVSRGCLERAIRKGARGVRLETIFICNRRFTSEEAIQRFIERTQNDSSLESAMGQIPNKLTAMSKIKLEKAREKFKLPTPESCQ